MTREEIVARLRDHAGWREHGGCAEHSMTDEVGLMYEAADRLEALERENAELREALKPFAAAGNAYGDKPGDATPLSDNQGSAWLEGTLITFGDLARASRLLNKETPDGR